MGTLAVDNIQHTDGSSAVTLNNATITTGTVGSGVTVEGTLNSNTTFSGDAGQRTAKAWVNFNGQGTVAIRYAYNVSSITDQGTGLSRITFSTAMNNVGYVVNGMVTRHGGVARGANGICLKRDVAPTTGYVDIEVHDQAHSTSDSTFNDNQFVMVQIFGD
jgi:hypothetical protein